MDPEIAVGHIFPDFVLPDHTRHRTAEATDQYAGSA